MTIRKVKNKSSILFRGKTLAIGSSLISDTKRLLKEGKIGTVAQALARNAFFGKEVMAQYMPSGTAQLKGLPRDEFNQLKVTMFKLLPHHHSCLLQFELDCAKYVIAVEQACKRERNKKM